MIRIVNQVDFFPGATSGALTIPATTAGNVLLVLVVTQQQGLKWVAPNFISSTDGNFTEVPFYSLQGGSLWDWGSIAGSGTSADALYQVTSGGVTVLNFNTNLAVDAIFVREVAGLVTPVVVDDFKATGSGSAVPVVGSGLSGTGINDLCYENFCLATGSPTGAAISSPWLVDVGLQDEGQGALFQRGVSGTQPAAVPLDSSGAQLTDTYTCVSVAFKGVGSPPTTPSDANGNPVTLKYVFGDNRNSLLRFVDTNNNLHTAAPLYSNDYSLAFNNFQIPPGSIFSDAWAVTMLGDHLAYVADQGTGILWQINLINGVTTRIAGGGTGSGFPNEIATNWHFGTDLFTVQAGHDGNLYLGVPGFETIICVNMQNTPIKVCGVTIPVGFAAEVAGSGTGQGFNSDFSVAVDALGNIYAGEEGDNTGHGNDIWKTNPAGVATKIAGNGTAANTGDGGPASAASLDSPIGIALDNNNILYIVCAGVNGGHPCTVRAINLSGVTRTVCGKTIASGNIDTIAQILGAGNWSSTGLSNTWSVTPDNQGNVYVADVGFAGGGKAWVHLIDASGNYTVIAGSQSGAPGYTGDGGPATNSVKDPYWISDLVNGLLRVDSAGIITKPTLNSTDPVFNVNGFFVANWGITADGSGNVFVVDQSAGSPATGVVFMLNDTTKTVTRIAGGGGSGALGYVFHTPYYVAVDSKGNLYISDVGDSCVLAVNRQATTQTILNVSIPAGGIAVVAGQKGVSGFSGDGAQATLAKLAAPFGIAIDSAGQLYIADQTNQRIRLVGTNGIITSPIGNGTQGFAGDNGFPASAELNRPLGVFIDAVNSIVITDTFNVVVRIINKENSSQGYFNTKIFSGEINTVAGIPGVSGFSGDGGQATAAKLGNSSGPTPSGSLPWFSGIDNYGNLYICDTGNFVVRIVNNIGVITTGVGTIGVQGLSGMGGPASSAVIGEPVAIAFITSFTARIGETFGIGIPVSAPPPPPPNFPAPPGGDRFKLTPSPTSGPVQNIPLDNAPNQTWSISVNVNGNPIPLKLVLRYNEIAAYWVATIFDGQGNLLLDSIPLITGAGISQNLLAQFPYLEIGSATIFNASQQA